MLNTFEQASVIAPVAVSGLPESEIEIGLDREIESLWSAHQEAKATAKHTREDLKSIRRNLGQKLYERKSLVVRTGRNGGWAAYLRSHGLPRASAERYIKQHETCIDPETNRTSGTIPEPTEVDVRRLVCCLLPRLCKVLTTPTSMTWFVAEVTAQLAALDSRPPGHIETEPANL